MPDTRRRSLATGAAASLIPFVLAVGRVRDDESPAANAGPRHTHPIALSTYSLWRFRNDELRDMDRCIDLAD